MCFMPRQHYPNSARREAVCLFEEGGKGKVLVEGTFPKSKVTKKVTGAGMADGAGPKIIGVPAP